MQIPLFFRDRKDEYICRKPPEKRSPSRIYDRNIHIFDAGMLWKQRNVSAFLFSSIALTETEKIVFPFGRDGIAENKEFGMSGCIHDPGGSVEIASGGKPDFFSGVRNLPVDRFPLREGRISGAGDPLNSAEPLLGKQLRNIVNARAVLSSSPLPSR